MARPRSSGVLIWRGRDGDETPAYICRHGPAAEDDGSVLNNVLKEIGNKAALRRAATVRSVVLWRASVSFSQPFPDPLGKDFC